MSVVDQSATGAGVAEDIASATFDEAAAKAAALFLSIYRGLEERRVAPVTDRSALRATFADTLVEDRV